MKSVLTVFTLSAIALGLAQSSYAHLYSSGSNTQSPLGTLFPMNSSGTIRIYNKLVIEGGKQYAHQYQADGVVTDPFMAAKDAAEAYRGEAFKDNDEAAGYIVNFKGE